MYWLWHSQESVINAEEYMFERRTLKAYDSLLNNKHPFPKIGWVGGLFREHLYGDITLRCISHHIRWAGGVFTRSNWAEVMLGSQVLQVVEEVVNDPPPSLLPPPLNASHNLPHHTARLFLNIMSP